MGTIDLRKFDSDQIVIHFGGQLTSVNAYTFANALVSFADTIRAVNESVNPGQNIEVRLEAVGPGSFKAVVKRVKKGLGGFFSRAPENLFWAIVAIAIVEPYFDDSRTIEILEERVVIKDGGDTIVMPREAYEQWQNVKENPNVQRGIRRTFETVEKDESIENFGITPKLDDEEPIVQITRDDFALLSRPAEIIEDGSKRRTQNNRVLLVVLKPWIDASKRKWSFEWNGVPISAYVRDGEFMERVKSHEIKFGNGDVLEVEIKFIQDYDEVRDIWINDTGTFEIVNVYAYLPKAGSRVELT